MMKSNRPKAFETLYASRTDGAKSTDQQSQQLFGVVDYKSDDFNIEAGIGFGLTPSSHRLVVKLMISRDIYKPRRINICSLQPDDVIPFFRTML